MLAEIIEKANDWKVAIGKYDKSVRKSADIAVQLGEARIQEDSELFDKTYKKFSRSMQKMISLSKDANEVLVAMECAILKAEPDLRTTLLSVLVTPPDYVGLDDKAFQAIEQQNDDFSSVWFVHEIYVAHCNILADKIIKIIQIAQSSKPSLN